mgnify:CR=1 FL=1
MFEKRQADKNLIFGIHPVIEAIKSGKGLDKLYLQIGLKGENFRELSKIVHDLKIPFQYVPIEKLNKISYHRNHQGAVAFLSVISYHEIENIIPGIFESGETPLILILDRITDVRNFGAICRTAECSGVHAVIIPSRGAAQINSDAVKTSAGALHKISVCRSENMKATISFLKNSGLKIVSATETGDKFYFETSFKEPTAIILGSEEDGISDEYLSLSDEKIKIPLRGEIESLNVSVAAGVILYETVRQRSQK